MTDAGSARTSDLKAGLAEPTNSRGRSLNGPSSRSANGPTTSHLSFPELAQDHRSRAHEIGLTDNEGSLLAIVLRQPQITAYGLLKSFQRSPFTTFNTSKGGVYPLIRRMKRQGLIVARARTRDARNTEHLECTGVGRDALRNWIMNVQPSHVLVDDPLQMRLRAFDLLDDPQRRLWLLRTRDLLDSQRKMLQINGQAERSFALANALASATLTSRRAWLESLEDIVFDL